MKQRRQEGSGSRNRSRRNAMAVLFSAFLVFAAAREIRANFVRIALQDSTIGSGGTSAPKKTSNPPSAKKPASPVKPPTKPAPPVKPPTKPAPPKTASAKPAPTKPAPKSSATQRPKEFAAPKESGDDAPSVAPKKPRRAMISIPRTTPEADALVNQANILRNQGTPEAYLSAAQKFAQAAEILGNISNREGQAIHTFNAGTTYLDAGEYDLSIASFGKAAKLYHDIDRTELEAEALIGMAKVYGLKRETEQSLFNFQQGGVIYLGLKKYKLAAEAFSNAGSISLHMRDAVKARGFFEQALEASRSLGDKVGEMNMLMRLGYTHEFDRNFAPALSFFSDALAIARVSDPREVPELQNKIGVCHKNLGDYPKALQAHQEALELYKAQNNAPLVRSTQSYIEQLLLLLPKPSPTPDAAPSQTYDSPAMPTPVPVASPTPTSAPAVAHRDAGFPPWFSVLIGALLLRAYPNNPAARKVTNPHAKCNIPK